MVVVHVPQLLVALPRRRKDHLEEDLPELVVLVAVDDEVDGRVDGGEEVRDAHDRLQPLVPVALHVHA